MLFACALLATACIERSNPFDPINNRTEAAEEIRKQDRPALVALIDAGKAFTAFLEDADKRLSQEIAANAEVVLNNSKTRGADDSIRMGNIAVEAYNLLQSDADSLRFKARYGSLDSLVPHVLHADFYKNWSVLQDRLRAVSKHIDNVNSSRFPLVIYSPAFIDSALQPVIRDTLDFARIWFRADSANGSVDDSNAVVSAYNQARIVDNEPVDAYNATILFRKRTRNENVIVRSDSLQANVSLAKAGDTLFLGPGTFHVDLQFTHSGTPDSPIVVRGFPGRATIIRPSLSGGRTSAMIIAKDQKWIQFESLVFRGGLESSVKLENNATDISFTNCLFDSSQGPGLEANDSDLKMKNCEVRANLGHGVRLGGGESTVRNHNFTNVLFARNGGAGLQSTSQSLEMTRCTLADNATDGIQLITPSQGINITFTVLARNHGFGINRHAIVDFQDKLAVSNSILFENGTNWGLDAMEEDRKQALIKDNASVDPDFIDPENFNYSPKPGSYLDGLETLPTPARLVIGYRKAAP